MIGHSEQQEFIEKAKEAIIVLNKREAVGLAERAVSELKGTDLVRLIEEGFSAGISVVGDRFGRGEMFLPELVAAAEAMKGALELMEPKLREGKVTRETLGKVVLATVEGDSMKLGERWWEVCLLQGGSR